MCDGLNLIGVDCATNPAKVGLARGRIRDGQVEILDVRHPDANMGALLAGWIRDVESGRCLLALDAPLGWPTALGPALVEHSAGNPVAPPPDLVFRRVTDRVIHSELGRRPLEVGADRIARTAHAALGLLQTLRRHLAEPIPLVWSPRQLPGVGAIEVYPAATLATCNLPSNGYKRSNHGAVRRTILEGLRFRMRVPAQAFEVAEHDADLLDAMVCVLAAADFARGRCIEPFDLQVSRREGWIWTRKAVGV